MKTVCIIPKGSDEGNLIWMPPYIYPKDHLHEGIRVLRDEGFVIEYLGDRSGIAFRSTFEAEAALRKLEVAFRWMDITFYDDEEAIDFDTSILDYAIVALPLNRLEIAHSIITNHICLFSPGDFWIENAKKFDGSDFELLEPQPTDAEKKQRKNLRDHITGLTRITMDVFQRKPLMVFPFKISYRAYRTMNQTEDGPLIRCCSEKAEQVMDLLRFYGADYTLPEALPARSGIWNDRYSAMYIYFPKEGVGHIQSREVELRTFIKSIGMDFYDTDNITIHPLMWKDTNELQNIIKHALRLNSAIQESDNDTMKFAQIMMLFEYIGNPYEYENFQKTKSQFLVALAKDKQRYHQLSERFKELTHGTDTNGVHTAGLRTQVIHTGKSLYDLVPDEPARKHLFQELHGYVCGLITHMMSSNATTWAEYHSERITERDALLA